MQVNVFPDEIELTGAKYGEYKTIVESISGCTTDKFESYNSQFYWVTNCDTKESRRKLLKKLKKAGFKCSTNIPKPISGRLILEESEKRFTQNFIRKVKTLLQNDNDPDSVFYTMKPIPI